jgi:hypothetical protein
MGGLFYLIGVALAAYAGYSDLQWFYIFISSLIMVVGYFIIRAPQIHGIISNDGFAAIPKLSEISLYSFFTKPVASVGSCQTLNNI